MRDLFDQLWVISTEMFGPSGPIYAIAALCALFLLVALPIIFRGGADPIKRLESLERRHESEVGSLRADHDVGKFKALAPYLEPTDKGELSEVRAKLIAAGYRSRAAVRYFYLIRAGLAIGLVAFGLFIFNLAQAEPDPARMLAFCGIAGIVGFAGPSYWVTRRKQARQQSMSNGFPDALDLMLVCVEAGQSLDQAVARVSVEIEHANDVLADELGIVSNEIRAGKDRSEVLRAFADRSELPDISAFVTVLIQSATFGTSVASALRVYASEMRDKRLMRAEEKANTLPTKLTLGTMFFTVPPLLMILIGPSLIEITRALADLNARASR